MHGISGHTSGARGSAAGARGVAGAAAVAARVLAVLLAALLALACVPARALAGAVDAGGELGIRLEVPSQAFVETGDGTRAADALLGIRLEVPSQAFAGDDAGSAAEAADGLFGIRLEVPTQAYVDGGGEADVKAADGMLGIRLQVPKQAFTDEGGDKDVRAAEGVVGIRLEVPSQAFTDDGPGADAKAVDGLVGIRLQVPKQAYVEGADGTRAADGLVGIRLAVAYAHTITFDANGHGGTTSVKVLDGACAVQPDPVSAEWEGHSIVGWYTDAACTPGSEWDFGSPVYRDVYLYAKWSDDPYPTKGYTLEMGCSDGAIAGVAATDAGWSADKTAYSGTYEVGKGMTLPQATRPGHSFEGWYADADGDGEPDFDGDPAGFISREETADVRFWAKWRELPPAEGEFWTVTFESNGGSAVSRQTVEKGSGGFAERPVPDPVRTGFEFTGWFADGMCRTPFDFEGTPIEADTTVYAGWKRAAAGTTVFHTVTFDARGGSPVGRQEVPDGGHAARPSDPAKDDCKFAGWYATAEGAASLDESALFDFSAPVTADATAYAGWRERQSFDVTFHAAGGSFEDAEGGVDMDAFTLKVKEGECVPLGGVPGMEGSSAPAPKRAGWQFTSWYPGTPEAGDYEAGPFDFEGTPINGPTDLWAGWGLRLDVTVPVSVGFAVDAGSREVTTPDAERYALKSRTVRNVTVDAVALTSEESELAEFFALPEGEAWGPVLGETTLSLRARDAEPEVSIALAGDAAAEAGERGRVWKNARDLGPDEREAFTIGAFSYGGTSFDESWRGGDPSSSLPVKLGMDVSDKLGVRTDLDGPQKITRLTLTVSARG